MLILSHTLRKKICIHNIYIYTNMQSTNKHNQIFKLVKTRINNYINIMNTKYIY